MACCPSWTKSHRTRTTTGLFWSTVTTERWPHTTTTFPERRPCSARGMLVSIPHSFPNVVFFQDSFLRHYFLEILVLLGGCARKLTEFGKTFLGGGVVKCSKYMLENDFNSSLNVTFDGLLRSVCFGSVWSRSTYVRPRLFLARPIKSKGPAHGHSSSLFLPR